jgi:formate/nitrite transporter
MDYIKPFDAVRSMVLAGVAKSELSAKDILVRGILSGALLACATSLAFTATLQTGIPLVGAIVFPVGFVMIILLGLELVTGNFALLPVAALERRSPWGSVANNLTLAFVGNLLGSVAYGILFYLAMTSCGTDAPSGVALKLAAAAEAKTNAYAAHGAAGLGTAFIKAILCNWMVCLGVVLPMTARSVMGKIAAAWLPIMTFFAQGFEHSVVNMFVIPTGILFGAKVSLANWWIWNQLPVTLGNLVGGLVFTGLLLAWTYPAGRSDPSMAAEPFPDGAQTSRA